MSFWNLVFGEDSGCESGDRGCGWGGGIGVVELASSLGMSVGGSGACNRGDAEVSSGGDVGVAGGEAGWRDCCRFLRIFG